MPANVIQRPQRLYDFTAFSRRTPTQQQPGDRLDAQFQNLIDAVNAIVSGLDVLRRPLTVDDLDPSLLRELVDRVRDALQPDVLDALQAASNARVANAEAQAASQRAQALHARADNDVADLNSRLDAVLQILSQRIAQVEDLASRAVAGPRNDTVLNPLLGPNAGGFYGADVSGATATASDYADVSIAWAEFMPTTIPPNILAINAVTGDHWSSRWWANRSANAFGMLAWWYQGSWPSPGPPSTPFTPTGDPIPAGAMYWDTTRQQMMVWTGTQWAVAGAPSVATAFSLFYLTTAGQTSFPTTAADIYGKSYTLRSDGTNGVVVYFNGVRLTPDDGTAKGDYTVNAATSTITLLKPAPAGLIVAIDVLVPQAQIAPGAVQVRKMKALVFDGLTAAFTLQATDNSTPAINSGIELFVALDGAPQEPLVDYTASAALITFAQAPRADSKSFIIWWKPGP